MFNHYNQWIPQVIDGNGQVPIFNIMNVRGYCIAYDGKILTFVFAADIAREGGLIQDVNVSRFCRNSLNKVCATSGTNLFQGNESQLLSQENETDQNFRSQVIENNTESFAHTCVRENVYEYETIRWNRFNKYLNDTIEIAKQKNPEILAWLQLPIHPYSYIPLEFAIMILMHCRSEQALNFQWTLTSMIVPQLQSNYFQYQQEQLQQAQQLAEYYQDFLDTTTVYSTTEIARDFHMTPQQLRKILQDLKVIFPCNKTWQISKNLIGYDLVRNKAINHANQYDHPYWTNFGRNFVIELLKSYGYHLYENNNKKMVLALNESHL